MKDGKTNPELIVVGNKCKVKMPLRWMRSNDDEGFAWLLRKIVELYYNKDDDSDLVAVIVKLRASHKWNTSSVDRLQVFKHDFDTIQFLTI